MSHSRYRITALVRKEQYNLAHFTTASNEKITGRGLNENGGAGWQSRGTSR